MTQIQANPFHTTNILKVLACIAKYCTLVPVTEDLNLFWLWSFCLVSSWSHRFNIVFFKANILVIQSYSSVLCMCTYVCICMCLCAHLMVCVNTLHSAKIRWKEIVMDSNFSNTVFIHIEVRVSIFYNDFWPGV